MESLHTVRQSAFTLVEVLVSMSVLILILLVLVQITNSTQQTWTRTTTQIEQFKEARGAFETVTRRLSQATLNTYWDYLRDKNTGAPTAYIRQSELRFISGNTTTLDIQMDDKNQYCRPTHAIFFQAPLGVVSNSVDTDLDNLLNTWGYFVEFGNDSAARPPFFSLLPNPPPLRYRFRLMELAEPSESFSLYSNEASPSPGPYIATTWFSTDLGVPNFPPPATRPVRVLAENVMALVILPKLSPQDESVLSPPPATPGTALSPTYDYSSLLTYNGPSAPSTANAAALNPKNQLPPVVQVTMVAVDETSYARFQAAQSSNTTMPVTPFLGANGSLFTDAASYAGDLQLLETNLQNDHLTYRVFTTAVSLKAAKWSRDQTN